MAHKLRKIREIRQELNARTSMVLPTTIVISDDDKSDDDDVIRLFFN